jgi:ribosome-binding factor A
MGKGYRAERLGEEIKKVVSELILKDIKDPRLSGIVSISAVEVTADYSYATLYISILKSSGTDKTEEEVSGEIMEAFKSAKGLFRREIGRQIKLKHVPDIIFKMDKSLEYGRRIDEVLAGLKNEE